MTHELLIRYTVLLYSNIGSANRKIDIFKITCKVLIVMCRGGKKTLA